MLGLRVASWVAFALIVVMTLGPISARPRLTIPANGERFGAYLLLGLCFAFAYPRRIFLLGVALIIAAGGLEWAQNFVPERDGRLEDFLFKAIGVVGGLIAARLVHLSISAARRDQSGESHRSPVKPDRTGVPHG